MREMNEFDADSILDDEVFIELFEMEDPILRSKTKCSSSEERNSWASSQILKRF